MPRTLAALFVLLTLTVHADPAAYLVRDFEDSSSPRALRASGNRVLFTATLNDRNAVGVSDGTRDGTFATALDVTINGNAAARGRYFFSDGQGLWSSDATLAGTTRIYTHPATPYALPNGVLFRGESSTVWFSDGTLAGTRQLTSLGELFGYVQILPAGDRAWLSVPGRAWITDGTDAGTMEVLPSSGWRGDLIDVVRAGSSYFLLESSGGSEDGPRLWKSNGTTAGTIHVRNLGAVNSLPSFVGAAGPFVWYRVDGRLYRSDGTNAGTIVLPATDACAGGAALGDALIFTTYKFPALTVWRSDGRIDGTTKLATMSVRSATSRAGRCEPLTGRAGRLYFPGWDTANGWEPWVTDGTIAGTRLLADLRGGAGDSNPEEFTVAGERVFFTADVPNIGREMWAIAEGVKSPRRRSVGRR